MNTAITKINQLIDEGKYIAEEKNIKKVSLYLDLKNKGDRMSTL
jgi:hypothetical protein